MKLEEKLSIISFSLIIGICQGIIWEGTINSKFSIGALAFMIAFTWLLSIKNNQ
jgi:hypothetical protein